MATASRRRTPRSRRPRGGKKRGGGFKLYILTSLLLISSALVVTVAVLAWNAVRRGDDCGGATARVEDRTQEAPLEEWPDEDAPPAVEEPSAGDLPTAATAVRGGDERPSSPPATARPLPSPSAHAQPVALKGLTPKGHERPGPERGSLVIVIDDVGMNLSQLEPFLRFPGPITFAVLPGLPYTKAAAQRIGAAGKEVILHQPMEAEGGQNTGPGAIRSSMNEFEVLATLSSNLTQVPGALGLNNHMGSLGTQDLALMRTIMGFCRERGLYFLDSRTTAKTLAPRAAQEASMEAWERDVFLDNESDRKSMEAKLREGMGMAERKGRAVMIGHVWSSDLASLLMDMYPELVEAGFSLTSISRMMRGLDDAGPGD